jgi:hypothetical protein
MQGRLRHVDGARRLIEGNIIRDGEKTPDLCNRDLLDKSSRACAIEANIRPVRASTISPDDVRCEPLWPRSKSRVPNISSSLDIACVTAGCERWIAREALVTLPDRATASNTRKCLKFGRGPRTVMSGFMFSYCLI